MADQWKEFFYCDSLDNDTLLVRGKKRTGSRSSNTNGNDNIISNGSGIAVADGQCMLIVDQGKIAEVCAEPGEYTYDTSSEPRDVYKRQGLDMINFYEVNETQQMIEHENLDVRTITLGISLLDCIDSNLDKLNQKVYEKITTVAKEDVYKRQIIQSSQAVHFMTP